MFDYLQIYERRERFMVGTADVLLTAAAGLAGLWTRADRGGSPRRVLVLRLERIGDLLMTLAALAAVRTRAPQASIHLVVGSWNRPLVPLLSSVDSHETLDVPWLARHAAGASNAELLRRSWAWRAQGFDLAMNFEPDIRSNLLLALSGAPRRVGFSSGGGGRLAHAVTDVQSTCSHVGERTATGRGRASFGRGSGSGASTADAALLSITEDARSEALRLLGASGTSLLVGIHVSGGRRSSSGTSSVSLTSPHGSHEDWGNHRPDRCSEDKPLVGHLASLLPPDVRALDVAGAIGLPILAALLERLESLRDW